VLSRRREQRRRFSDLLAGISTEEQSLATLFSLVPTPWLQVTDMLLNMIAKAEAHDEAYKTEACRLSAVFSAHLPAL
jgi:hypothetical protein